jgi:hypothetical protein
MSCVFSGTGLRPRRSSVFRRWSIGVGLSGATLRVLGIPHGEQGAAAGDLDALTVAAAATAPTPHCGCQVDLAAHGLVSLPYGLTVWVRDGQFRWLRLDGCGYDERPLVDLAATVEDLVHRYERLRRAVMAT